MLKWKWYKTQELIDDDIYTLEMRYHRWALMYYILDPFSQLRGDDIDG